MLLGRANVAIGKLYLQSLSVIDNLTKAYIWRCFLLRLEEEMRRAESYGRNVSANNYYRQV